MDRNNSEVPLCSKPITVGIIYNLKKGIVGKTEDVEAEYDSIDTVTNLKKAFEGKKHVVKLIEADENLPYKLRDTKIDIAFNIAEGFNGRGREAQVPSLLNMYKIPYTGSDETTLAMALDKALTKRYMSTFGVKTPGYMTVSSIEQLKDFNLNYPVIVKPNAEGSSKGITSFCVAKNSGELHSLVQKDLDLYDGSMLIEEFIVGREFTVGMVGNGSNLKVFPPMEIKYREKSSEFNIYSYEVKKAYLKYISYECPAKLEPEQQKAMVTSAEKVFHGLNCYDFCRADFMMDKKGEVYFIECNPLPGLAKDYSDLPMLAALSGVEYDDLVCTILNDGIERNFIK